MGRDGGHGRALHGIGGVDGKGGARQSQIGGHGEDQIRTRAAWFYSRSTGALRGEARGTHVDTCLPGLEDEHTDAPRMATSAHDAPLHPPDDPVLAWLLDSDPAIRWQVLRDLTDAPAEVVAVERARVATEGWGAQVLGLQRPDGQWGDGVAVPFWWTNMYSLVYLRDFGIDPAEARVRAAIARVKEQVTWGPEFGNSPFFAGEVEPCINGRVVALGAYFGVRDDKLVDRLLGEQLGDGGWNCEAERGSKRSSFHTTLCVLEGLLAYEQALGATESARAAQVAAARARAHEYLLQRRLLRRLSTGEVIDFAWTQLAFPPLWHYDVLRGLEYFRAAGVRPEERTQEAIETLRSRRQADGRWRLDVRHKHTLYPEMAGGDVGESNRWITLRALRVLRWWDDASAARAPTITSAPSRPEGA